MLASASRTPRNTHFEASRMLEICELFIWIRLSFRRIFAFALSGKLKRRGPEVYETA